MNLLNNYNPIHFNRINKRNILIPKYINPLPQFYVRNKKRELMEYNMLVDDFNRNGNPMNNNKAKKLDRLKERIFSDFDTRKEVIKRDNTYIVPVLSDPGDMYIKDLNGNKIKIKFVLKSTYLNDEV